MRRYLIPILFLIYAGHLASPLSAQSPTPKLLEVGA